MSGPASTPGRGSTSAPERDYSYLCGNCGAVESADDWTAWVCAYVLDEDAGDEWVPAPDGYSDPMIRCPSCGFEHTDDDSGPGMWAGTRLEMQREKRDLLRDPLWADAWEDVRRGA